MKRKNNLIRNISALLAITIFSTGLVFAQPRSAQGPPSPPSDKEINKMVKDLDKELDLSDKQNEQVSELYMAHFDKVEALMENSQRPNRTKMEALDTELEEQMNALLNEDQQKLYSAWLKEQEQQRSSRRPQGGQRPAR